LHGDNFSLIFTPNGQQTNRLGISIHGQLKGSVRRNRIKRIIREFYRLNRTFLQRGPGGTTALQAMDIVFTVRQGFSLDSPAAMAQAVSLLLAKQAKVHETAGKPN
jgi:ribonuclease P protein component